jgi:hypothetical protein
VAGLATKRFQKGIVGGGVVDVVGDATDCSVAAADAAGLEGGGCDDDDGGEDEAEPPRGMIVVIAVAVAVALEDRFHLDTTTDAP